MYKTAYWGYSERMLEDLINSPLFELAYVLTVKNRVNDRYLELLEENGIRHSFIRERSDLQDYEYLLGELDCIIMYKFEFIIPEAFIRKGRIVNFHGGRLTDNRGAHAVVRSILNRDKETCLSLYELTGGIDEGLLIAEHTVEISADETPDSLNKKLADGIPELLTDLDGYLSGSRKARLVEGGVYLPKVTEEDYTIHVDTDSPEIISAKIRSQNSYRGAVLPYLGRTYYVREMLSPGEKKVPAEDMLLLEIPRDGETLRFIVRKP